MKETAALAQLHVEPGGVNVFNSCFSQKPDQSIPDFPNTPHITSTYMIRPELLREALYLQVCFVTSRRGTVDFVEGVLILHP